MEYAMLQQQSHDTTTSSSSSTTTCSPFHNGDRIFIDIFNTTTTTDSTRVYPYQYQVCGDTSNEKIVSKIAGSDIGNWESRTVSEKLKEVKRVYELKEQAKSKKKGVGRVLPLYNNKGVRYRRDGTGDGGYEDDIEDDVGNGKNDVSVEWTSHHVQQLPLSKEPELKTEINNVDSVWNSKSIKVKSVRDLSESNVIFGLDFRNKINNKGKNLSPLRSGSTTIHCTTLDHDIPHTLCDSYNIAINVDQILGLENNFDAGSESLVHSLTRLPDFGSGVVEGTCGLDEEWWVKSGLIGPGAPEWLLRGFNISRPSSNKELECDAWIGNPVYMISRWDTTNPYQTHQDLINTYQTYITLNLSVADTQVVLLDTRMPDGPFPLASSNIFSSSGSVTSIRNLVNLPGLQKNGSGGRVCFKRIVWGLHGGISPLAMGGRRLGNCQGSSLLISFRRFMVDRIRYFVSLSAEMNSTTTAASSVATTSSNDRTQHLLNPLPLPDNITYLNVTPPAVPASPSSSSSIPWFTFKTSKSTTPQKPSWWTILWRWIKDSPPFIPDEDTHDIPIEPITITYAIRKSGTKLNIINNDEHVQLQNQTTSPTTTTSSISRILKNENDLISYLQSRIQSWNQQIISENKLLQHNRKHLPIFRFQAIDFATLSFVEQVSVAQGTDVFLGPHGAVFVYGIYLRSRPVAGVLELQPPERSGEGNFQFWNLARMMGHR
ncbi:hypothetical protein HDU76_007968, partial [Blyttiomyces sp. JEL0837]